MKLVNLEDVQKIITSMAVEFDGDDKKVWTLGEASGKINSLPTYNPEQVIKDMIEEIKIIPDSNFMGNKLYTIGILVEALSRITNINN